MVERVARARPHAVVVTARMVQGAEEYLREDTQFWVVKPRIGVGGGVGPRDAALRRLHRPRSGRGRAHAGRSSAWRSRRRSAPTSPGRSSCCAPTLGSVERGLADLLPRHRDRPGGRLRARRRRTGLDHRRSSSRRRTTSWCAPTSRFWNASGIDVAAGASGIDVAGRVAAVAADRRHRVRHAARHVQPARWPTPGTPVSRSSPSQRALAQAQFTEKIPFLVYFDGSVRGLKSGRPGGVPRHHDRAR